MQVYNTFHREKEDFVPINQGKVGMYVCGPTVYNYFHVGNARPFIIFDTLRRYLEYKGYDVTYVQNLTDIDDKMINKANEEGITVSELAERFIAEYFTDADGLGIRRADVHPRATEHIPEIIALIAKLIAKGYAYEVNGDVYFDTQAYPQYGRLSGQNLDELESGARVDVDEEKKHPMDFALWKAQKPGEPAWESPWGPGRPGWHIECSAMSMKYLGDSFDIHGGGQDLTFPHHENEVAQSEAATGKPFAKYFMHNGYININNEKMSKSLGNFFTVRDISKDYDLEVVRLFMLSAHYRNPINFSRELLDQAKAALERLYNARDSYAYFVENAEARPMDEEEQAFVRSIEGTFDAFDAAMDDDLNTAGAIGVIFDFVRDANSLLSEGSAREAAEKALEALNRMTDVLGLLFKKDEIPAEIVEMAEKRLEARKNRDFAEADRLRDAIKEQGYVLEDTPQGFKVKKA